MCIRDRNNSDPLVLVDGIERPMSSVDIASVQSISVLKDASATAAVSYTHLMGYQSVLVDALWDKQIGRDKIEELAKYGKDKGVALYLWYRCV